MWIPGVCWQAQQVVEMESTSPDNRGIESSNPLSDPSGVFQNKRLFSDRASSTAAQNKSLPPGRLSSAVAQSSTAATVQGMLGAFASLRQVRGVATAPVERPTVGDPTDSSFRVPQGVLTLVAKASLTIPSPPPTPCTRPTSTAIATGETLLEREDNEVKPRPSG